MIIIFAILIAAIFLQTCFSPKKECFENKKIKKLPLWVYWEGNMPPYIKLCIESIKKCDKYFELTLLNEKNVFDYLPNLRKDIDELLVAQKADYIRVSVLYEYGGLWLDADTLVLTDLKPIFDKLNEKVDYVGFGCTGNICLNAKDGYGKPSNWAMGSQKNGILMKNCLKSLNEKIDSKNSQNNYFEFGKLIIWKELEKLMNNEHENYSYFHFSPDVDGTRNKKGEWTAPNMIFKDKIDFINEKNLMFIVLANSYYCGSDKKYNWFCNKSKNDILDGEYFISKYFKKIEKI